MNGSAARAAAFERAATCWIAPKNSAYVRIWTWMPRSPSTALISFVMMFALDMACHARIQRNDLFAGEHFSERLYL